MFKSDANDVNLYGKTGERITLEWAKTMRNNGG